MILRAKKRIIVRLKINKKARDGYVCMYECGKYLLHSSYERRCAAREMTISKMKYIVEIFDSEINKIRSTNQDMLNYIDSYRKES